MNINIVLADPVTKINFITQKDDQLLIREDNIFVVDSTLTVSITTPITYNRYRLVAMDYVMVITDPYENIVFIDLIKDRSRSYTTQSNVIFSKKIPDNWLNGEYLIEIYSYDRVDYSELSHVDFDIYDKDSSIDDLMNFYTDPTDSLLEDLEVLKSRSDAHIIKDELHFYIDKNSNPCKIQDLSVSHNAVPLNSTLQVFAEVQNTIPKPVNTSLQLLLNNKPIKKLDIIMGPNEWKHLVFEITDPMPGDNQINLGKKKINFTVSDTPMGPINLVYLDISTDKQKIYAQEPFNISVTVMNTGSRGHKSVYLLLNNITISKEIEVNFSERKTINFEVLLNESGTYQAQIIGTEVSKIIFVQEAQKNINDEEKQGLSIFPVDLRLIPAGIIIIVLLLFMLGLRMYYNKQQKAKDSQLTDINYLKELI